MASNPNLEAAVTYYSNYAEELSKAARARPDDTALARLLQQTKDALHNAKTALTTWQKRQAQEAEAAKERQAAEQARMAELQASAEGVALAESVTALQKRWDAGLDRLAEIDTQLKAVLSELRETNHAAGEVGPVAMQYGLSVNTNLRDVAGLVRGLSALGADYRI